jgi:hypothetical protein
MTTDLGSVIKTTVGECLTSPNSIGLTANNYDNVGVCAISSGYNTLGYGYAGLNDYGAYTEAKLQEIVDEKIKKMNEMVKNEPGKYLKYKLKHR